MKEMYSDLHSKGLEIVGVTTYYGFYGSEKNLTPGQEFAKLADHIKEFALPWPWVIADKSNFQSYGVGGIPHYVVVGRDGKVAAYTIGYNEPLGKQLRGQIEKALAQQSAAR